jgi:endogenous inhibitor of DNA gyrase (YacG/DUF329 family)
MASQPALWSELPRQDGPKRPRRRGRPPRVWTPISCRTCGNIFRPDRRHKFCCSLECGAGRIGCPPKARKPIPCRTCGSIFRPDRLTQRTGYCSRECGADAHRRRQPTTHEKPCTVCGRSIKGTFRQKFCSAECSAIAHTKVCARCQQPFVADGYSDRRRFCSKRCRALASRTNIAVCKNCNETFHFATHGRRDRPLYCCHPCYLEDRFGIKRSRGRKAVMARSNTAKVRTAIFERDRYRCWLCEKPINARLKWPHPKSASIDHYIPVAEGGTDDPGNLCAAHLVCNIVRHTAPPTKAFQLSLELEPMGLSHFAIANAQRRRTDDAPRPLAASFDYDTASTDFVG